MNYSDIKKEIIGLGFSDESELEEFGELVPFAINRSIAEIGNIYPIYGKIEFEFADEDTGEVRITLSELEETDGKFLELRPTPVLYKSTNANFFRAFNDYSIEREDTVVIDADKYKGTFNVYYSKAMDRYTLIPNDDEHAEAYAEQEEKECELPLKAHRLIPLLASYFVWLEDDATKASQYYNLYEQMLARMTSDSTRPRIRIMEGGI